MESKSQISTLKWNELRAAGAIHPIGVYENMSEEEYHSDISLSQSGIKNINISPLTYWKKSNLNPRRKEKQSDAKDEGKAFHKRLLEGKAAFAAAFAEKPSPEMFGANVIAGGEALRKKCEVVGVAKNGTLLEMAERIAPLDAGAKLYPLLEREYLKKHDGKTFIDGEELERIELAVAALELNPEVVRYLEGTKRELSLFWDDPLTGVPMKARLDAYKTGVIFDPKHYANMNGLQITQAVTSAITKLHHGVQAVCYKAGVLELLKDDAEFIFAFQQSGDIPDVGVFRYKPIGADGEVTGYFDTAHTAYRRGIDRWQRCYEHFGASTPWVFPTRVQDLEDTDFPAWAFN